ncbi:MAG: PCRF domain-containing protein, partial [Thermodesulfovibrionales bacterium]|nr:PCRF domain-containing protein [Thermodesulfovibrionales bacterium]
MLDKLIVIEDRYNSLTTALSTQEVLSNPLELQKLSKEKADLEPVVSKIRDYKRLLQDIDEAEQLLKSPDHELKELAQSELDNLKSKKPILENELKILLLPRDPRDEKNVILEIRAGTGGEEAALFAAALFRMYSK